MQIVRTILSTLFAQLGRLWRYWLADIRNRRSWLGKIASVVMGLVALMCACTLPLTLLPSSRTPVASQPTAAPRATEIDPTLPPMPSPTTVPTDTPVPTEDPLLLTAVASRNEPVPTLRPNPTDAPVVRTKVPAEALPQVLPTEAPTVAPAPEPTAEPAPEPTAAPAAAGPTFTDSSPSRRRVDPPYWPCNEGQLKGNNRSDIYHSPGQRDYAFTHADVTCFDTAAQAEAAGFRAAQR